MLWLGILIIIAGIILMDSKITQAEIKSIKTTWWGSVSYYAKVYGVPESLILAVIFKESRGNANATGSAGDYGLMQITQPALTDFDNLTGHFFTLVDMLDGDSNIMVGTWYLAHLHNAWILTWFDTLRAYNVGIGTVLKNSTAGQEYAQEVENIQKTIEEVNV